MPEESPSIIARIRASLAGALGGLGRGAHRLEEWSSRGTRTIMLTLVAIAVLSFGALAVMHETHAFSGWMGGGHHDQRFERGPGPKPEGKPDGGPFGRAIGKPEGKPEGKPHVPPPGPPAPPPAPAAPPAGTTQP